MKKIFLLAALAVFFIAMNPVKVKASEMVIVKIPQMENPEIIAEEIKEDELQMLAILVMAEAGNQDLEGKRLVVDVVLNRVDDSRWPNTITEVINQPYQFSPMRNGAFEKAAETVTDECFEAVALELESRLDYDIHYFQAGGYGYGKAAYKHGDHFFSY